MKESDFSTGYMSRLNADGVRALKVFAGELEPTTVYAWIASLPEEAQQLIVTQLVRQYWQTPVQMGISRFRPTMEAGR